MEADNLNTKLVPWFWKLLSISSQVLRLSFSVLSFKNSVLSFKAGYFICKNGIETAHISFNLLFNIPLTVIATGVSRPHYNFFPYSFDLIVPSLKQMLWLQLMETEIFRYVNSIQWKLLVFTFLLTNNETSMCIQCWRLEHHTETVAEKGSCFGVWNVSNVVWICFCGGIFLLKLINLWNSLKFLQTKKRGH